MRRPFLSAAVIVVGLAMAQSARSAVKHTIGVARNQTDDSVRYIEHHQYLEDGKHIVRYYDNANNVLLEKEISYPGLPQHPTLVQSDFLTDTDIRISREQGNATMIKERGDESEQFTFPLTEDTVIDAGFDRYIQDNWSKFEDSATHRVKFAVAGQARLLEMNISRTGQSEDLTRFIVQPANWFVRLLVSDITLYYDDMAQLARYEGFSNLKPAREDSREVTIQFEHFVLDRALNAPLAEWLPIASSR